MYTAAMRRIVHVLLLILVAQITSCAAPEPTAGDPLEIAPSDFYIDATVLAAPASRSADAAKDLRRAPSHLWPGRYVLFADGTLRQGFDATGDLGANWLPPITRILTHEQTASAWSLAQQLGLTDPQAGESLINPNLVKADPGERVMYLDFRGNGQRWNFIRRTPLDQPPDAAIAQLLQHLAGLSWTDHETASDALITPKRYDFGPDPYERYRNRTPQP